MSSNTLPLHHISACVTDIGEADAPPATKSRRKRPPAVLRRPVICVCNDVFAPALRPLRDVAQELRLRRVVPERLVRRLKAVCAQERVDTDRQVRRSGVGSWGSETSIQLKNKQCIYI